VCFQSRIDLTHAQAHIRLRTVRQGEMGVRGHRGRESLYSATAPAQGEVQALLIRRECL